MTTIDAGSIRRRVLVPAVITLGVTMARLVGTRVRRDAGYGIRRRWAARDRARRPGAFRLD